MPEVLQIAFNAVPADSSDDTTPSRLWVKSWLFWRKPRPKLAARLEVRTKVVLSSLTAKSNKAEQKRMQLVCKRLWIRRLGRLMHICKLGLIRAIETCQAGLHCQREPTCVGILRVKESLATCLSGSEANSSCLLRTCSSISPETFPCRMRLEILKHQTQEMSVAWPVLPKPGNKWQVGDFGT